MSTKRKGSGSKRATSKQPTPQALPDESYEATIARNKRAIDRSINVVLREVERENELLQASAHGRVQRVLKIYRGLKPFFAVLISLPLFPSPWRAALFMFSRALEAITVADLTMGKEG